MNKIMKKENKYLFKILKKKLRGVAPNTGIAATYRQFATMICVNFFIEEIKNDFFSKREIEAIEKIVIKCANQAVQKLENARKWAEEETVK